MIMDIEALSAAADEASEFLKSLASPVRLQILCSILSRELPSESWPSSSACARASSSQHLALLRKDGLVRTRQGRPDDLVRVGRRTGGARDGRAAADLLPGAAAEDPAREARARA